MRFSTSNLNLSPPPPREKVGHVKGARCFILQDFRNSPSQSDAGEILADDEGAALGATDGGDVFELAKAVPGVGVGTRGPESLTGFSGSQDGQD